MLKGLYLNKESVLEGHEDFDQSTLYTYSGV